MAQLLPSCSPSIALEAGKFRLYCEEAITEAPELASATLVEEHGVGLGDGDGLGLGDGLGDGVGVGVGSEQTSKASTSTMRLK